MTEPTQAQIDAAQGDLFKRYGMVTPYPHWAYIGVNNMNELIWVGNTLLPRWFVFGSVGAVLLAIIILWTWWTER